ncbi:hypothetical protein LTR09_001125 [Extremus antarcticus]|uniref:DJ-1/PfpI domain-containing protein n=1 Tax=Extremus antarcticus TaxID=702011 RepID=A0AAJ0GI63_9PEZI|nr:hypothetical protein LTR09_001125 [Extremus antarcticus]
MGPLEALQTLARKVSIDVSFIGETLDPVSPKPAVMTPISQNAWQDVVPTHTYDNPPSDLEVLMVPGGAWSRNPDLNTTFDFLKDTYPELKYFFTACTGSYVAARSGLLDGKRATTNKAAYTSLTPLVPAVDWVPHARWVVDGNIWTTSGVSAGIDGTLALIECLYGTAMTEWISDQMEYERHTYPRWDPFAAVFNVTDA